MPFLPFHIRNPIAQGHKAHRSNLNEIYIHTQKILIENPSYSLEVKQFQKARPMQSEVQYRPKVRGSIETGTMLSNVAFGSVAGRDLPYTFGTGL